MYRRIDNVLVVAGALSLAFGHLAQARGAYTPRVKMAQPPAASGKPSLENMRAAIYSAMREALPLYAGTVNHVAFDQRQEVILNRYAGPPVPEMRFEGVVYFQSAYESGRRVAYRTRVRWEGHPNKWRVVYLEVGNMTPVRDELHPRPQNHVLTELQGAVHDVDGLRDELRQRLELEVRLEEWRPRGLAYEHEREELLHKLEGEQAAEQDLAPLRQEVADLQAQLVKAEDDRLAVRRRRQWLQGEVNRRQDRLIMFLRESRGKPQARAALGSLWLEEQRSHWTRRSLLRSSTVSTALAGAAEVGGSATGTPAPARSDGATAAEEEKATRETETQWYGRLVRAVRELAGPAATRPKR